MASDFLLQINTFALLASLLATYCISTYFAKKAQGIAEKSHFLYVALVSVGISVVLGLPLFLMVAIAVFGMVVYCFKMSNY